MINVAEKGCVLGLALNRNGGIPFRIQLKDRLMHLHVVGQTGTGKSTLLGNLALQDAQRGFGFCLIDPHGDLAEALAKRLPERAIVWTPADPTNPYGYNPLTRVPAEYRPLVASGLIDAFKKQWADAWGVRMEHLFRHALLTLLDQPQADFRDVMPLFLDKALRSQMMQQVSDSQVRHFWAAEFDNMNYKNALDGVAPIANKLGAFLAHPTVRQALCHPERPLRFRKIMDEGQVLIINLCKGRLGVDVANVLGGLIVGSIVNAAFSRQSLQEGDRRPFMLHVDEFHSFTTGAIADLLPETRKYGLGLTLAHQHVAQVDAKVFDAILGNVGSLLAFRVGANDAPIFQRQLERVTNSDLINLPNRRAYLRLMLDGQRTQAFSVATSPLP
ncbi:type IV secretion system DNA-binding domain-containing protein [Sulfitobacter sp. JBTF-M27]|uniref:Type IV secretion system DNA-binding domain-containing protein n=2 Tax=Sulfitobacter sediminilitoris TaxID=2698830 RepID=A0A6P0CG06_9RHOB|nr:type IV secretion system DNA-binding domain-containing protein [Sulfitobacter sediminilitoris]